VAIISVIIVNWNSKELVRQCLLSLGKQPSAKDLEIIVVDSGSFDGCQKVLADEFPHVVFLQLEKNVGFGRANNSGFEQATADYIWFLNPDTEAVGDAASELLAALQSQKEIGMVGAKLLNSDGTLQTTCVQSLPTVFNQAIDSELLRRRLGLWGMSAFRSESKAIEVEAISGACMMLRSSDFRRAGCFDPRYFMFCEDMELCFNIRKLGLKILYVPLAVVFHHGGTSTQRQVSKFSVVMMKEALMAYLLKHGGIMSAYLYRFILTLSATSRIGAILLHRLFTYAFNKKGPDSLGKWVTVLSWCVGRERWAKPFTKK
jgi:N-acetylglucosaminyl-diphospho-decaprenol L-rhamnosyltransferase